MGANAAHPAAARWLLQLENMDDPTTLCTAAPIAGLVRRTKRAGAAGDLEAQAVSDPLLTASAAHRCSGRAAMNGSWQNCHGPDPAV